MIAIKSVLFKRRFRWQISYGRRRRHIAGLFLVLIFLMLVHTVLMVLLEGLSLGDAAWLTLTTVTTVGYGDLAAETPMGRFATVALLYIFGIFLLAQIAGEWIDYRIDRRDRMLKGLWRWKMKNHIVILNTPSIQGDRYLQLLVEQIRVSPGLQHCPIQVFTSSFPDGLPANLLSMDVVLRTENPDESVPLNELDIKHAAFVLLLATDTHDSRSDSVNLDLLNQLHEQHPSGRVIAESVLESNRERFKKQGADAVIRPIRAYPELLVRSMSAPGTEEILEDLFVHAGNHPWRYDVEFTEQPWGAMASKLLMQGLGTPLGYLDRQGTLITNPPPDACVSGKALFIMVSQDRTHQQELIVASIAAINR